MSNMAHEEQYPDELTMAYLHGVHDGKKQRVWVGLTDEDYQDLRTGVVKQGKPLHWMIEHIETRLKEKNHG